MSLSEFFKENLDYVIVVYGLSFILMFFVVFAQRRKAAHFELLESFKYLSAFGLFHGIADFMVIAPNYLSMSKGGSSFFLVFKFTMFVISYQFLLQFSLNAMVRESEKRRRWMLILAPYLLLVYIFAYSRVFGDFAAAVLVIRRFLSVPANILASLAFLKLYSEARKLGLAGLERYFLGVAVGFLSYGFFAGVLTATYPGTGDILGIPTQVFRALSAIIITIFVAKILSVFEVEPVTDYRPKEISR